LSGGGPTRAVLPNGLTVLTVTRSTSPIVAVMIMYRAGSRYDPPGATGLAHLTEHMMFRGTPDYPHGEIDRLTGTLGGTNNAMTTADHALYYFVLPARHWRTPLAIEADRMTNCPLDQRAFEPELNVAIEERRMLDDDPEARAYEAVDALALGNHPYRNPVVGTSEDLERLSVDHVRSFYGDRYRPDNAVLAVVGGVESDDVEEEASRLFGGITRDGAVDEPEFVENTAPALRRSEIDDPCATPRVVTAFRTPGAADAAAAPLELVADLLAAGRSSLLYRGLVEGGLATEVSASRLLQRDPSLFYVSATLHSDADCARCESEIAGVLESLAARALSDGELGKLKNLARVDTLLSRETCLGEAGGRAFWELLGGWRLGDDYEAGLESADAEAVRRAAGDYLDPQFGSTVWLIP
jgi:zinc protease